MNPSQDLCNRADGIRKRQAPKLRSHKGRLRRFPFFDRINSVSDLVLCFARALTGHCKGHLREAAQPDFPAPGADHRPKQPCAATCGRDLQQQPRDAPDRERGIAPFAGVLQSFHLKRRKLFGETRHSKPSIIPAIIVAAVRYQMQLHTTRAADIS